MLLLTHEEVKAAIDMTAAIEATEAGYREEADGKVVLPKRLNAKAGKGWLRVGPAVLEGSGYMGFKAMNLCPGQGVRYQVHIYKVETGELLAIMDAQHLTTLRTGATSAVATRRLARAGQHDVAVLGAGAEARAQIDAMAALGIVREARVFSRTPANREKFVEEIKASLGIAARPVDHPRTAVEGAGIVVAAVKSTETVLLGEWLAPGTHVNSVGTARPEQREIDPVTFTRSSTVVVDTREGVFGEAGDALAAREVFAAERAHELADLVGGRAPGRKSDEEITLFKSVGTTVQDIAVAARIYENAKARGLGRDLGAFPYLKKS